MSYTFFNNRALKSEIFLKFYYFLQIIHNLFKAGLN